MMRRSGRGLIRESVISHFVHIVADVDTLYWTLNAVSVEIDWHCSGGQRGISPDFTLEFCRALA